MTSGGLDSALLLYLIAREAASTGQRVDALTIPGPDNSIQHSSDIVAEVNRLLAQDLHHSILPDPRAGSGKLVTNGVAFALIRREYDQIFLATTQIPEHLRDSFGVPVRSTRFHPKLTQPWVSDTTKDQIAKYVIHHGLTTLIQQSHSCTVQSQGHCGWCWNCQERTWALNQADFG